MNDNHKAKIEIKGLEKSYGAIKALNGVDLTIDVDGVFGLLGPNGAGKSTLISSILGLFNYDAGQITIDSKPHNPSSVDFKKRIGIVPQELAIYPDLSAITNLKFFGSLFGMTGSQLDDRAHELLKLTGLSDRAKDRVDTFSGGMKRRLNLAVGIIHQPEIVMMDEPTVGIDPQSRNLIYDLVESLANSGMRILYTTHYMDEAERLCKRIAIIDMGKIIAEGTLDELIETLGESDIIRLEIRGEPGDLNGIVADGKVDRTDSSIVIKTTNGASKLPGIIQNLTSKNCEILSATIWRANLETVFLHLTGRGLRD
jgi:ABC-2 type transport system ATP-binding protein